MWNKREITFDTIITQSTINNTQKFDLQISSKRTPKALHTLSGEALEIV